MCVCAAHLPVYEAQRLLLRVRAPRRRRLQPPSPRGAECAVVHEAPVLEVQAELRPQRRAVAQRPARPSRRPRCPAHARQPLRGGARLLLQRQRRRHRGRQRGRRPLPRLAPARRRRAHHRLDRLTVERRAGQRGVRRQPAGGRRCSQHLCGSGRPDGGEEVPRELVSQLLDSGAPRGVLSSQS